MHFEVLQSMSLNGSVNRPNDDRFGSNGRLAWVIDGATDMGPPGLLGPQGGASWLASTASKAFTVTQATTIEATCLSAFAEIEREFEDQRTRDIEAAWEMPKAAFGIAQLTSEGLSVGWAADSPILRVSGDDVTWCTGVPDTSAEAADALALGVGVGAAGEITGHVLEDRRAHRAQDGHAALSPIASASAKVTCYDHHPVAPGDDVILMSDGFASLVTDYKLYTAETLVAAIRSRGLTELAGELREVEQADAGCIRFPRFKVSDDATALWLRVTG